MSAPQVKQRDQERIVALLAEESQVPLDDVAKLYEHEHAELAIGARITKFLHIFATRNVQEILRKQGIEKLATPAPGRPVLAAQRLLMPLRSIRLAAPSVAGKPPRP